MNGTSEKRRVARIPLACTVTVREKFATWTTETQDVGARGCRIALPRPLAPGALVRLRIERDGGAAPLEALGQVAWSRKTRPLDAGIVFLDVPRDAKGAPVANWIDGLVADTIRRALARGPEASAALGGLGDVALHLGTPPSGAVTLADLTVLRVAREGGPLSAIGRSPDVLEALAALVERGALTVRRTTPDPAAWNRAFRVVAEDASAARQDAQGAAAAVIVPPLPEAAWRRPAAVEVAGASLRDR